MAKHLESRQQHPVNTPVPEWDAMMKRQRLPHIFMGSTFKSARTLLIEAGAEFTPAFEKEDTKKGKYLDRLNKTFLYPGFKRAIKSHSSRIHSEPIKRSDKLSDRVNGWLDDVDGQGTSLDAWAPQLLEAAEIDGVTHVLVDQPKLPEDATDADAIADGVRPIWIHVMAEQLIGWQYKWFGGRLFLTQIRIRESARNVSSDDVYQSETARRVRVLTPGKFELWEEARPGKEEFTVIDEGSMGIGHIPLVTFYACTPIPRIPFIGCPMLEDLSEKNLEHWQSSSEQANHRSFIRFPVLWGPQEKVPSAFGSGIYVGVGTDGSLNSLQHSTAGDEAGWRHLDKTKQEMDILGFLPLATTTSGVPSATEQSLKAAEAQSDVQKLSVQENVVLQRCLELSGQWQNIEIPKSALESVRDFFSLLSVDDIPILVQALVEGNKLPKVQAELIISELQRHDILKDTESPKELIASRPEPAAEPEELPS